MKIVNDNYLYARVSKMIDDKSKLTEDHIPMLTEVLGDEDKAKEVVEAGKASMGKCDQALRIYLISRTFFLFSSICTRPGFITA